MHNKGGNENASDKAKSRSLNISMITLTRSVSPSKYDWIFLKVNCSCSRPSSVEKTSPPVHVLPKTMHYEISGRCRSENGKER